MNKILGIFFIFISLAVIIYGFTAAAVNFPWRDYNDRNQSKKYITQKKYDLAVVAAKKAFSLSSLDVRNIRQLVLANYYAGVNLDKKYQKENIPIAEKLVYYSPTDPLSWDLLGLVYLNVGRLEEAKSAFNREKILTPNSTGVYLHLGEVLKQQGKTEEAITHYKKAIEISGGWDFAEKELEKAEKLLPQK